MKMKLTSMRISTAQHQKADHLIEYLGSLNHSPATRSEVLRVAIARGLVELEKDRRVSEGAANATA